MAKPDILPLIAKIYEAPLQLRSWGDAVGAVARHFDAAAGGQFHIFDVRQRRMLFSCMPDPTTAEGERIYNEHFAATDPRRALVDHTACGEWVFDQDHFDEHYVQRSDVYQFLLGFDIRYAAATKLAFDQGAIAAFAIFRGQRQAPFSELEKQQLTVLSPHLVQSAQLTVQLHQLRIELARRSRALDALKDAVIAVDASMRIVFHNAAAEQLFRGGTVLQSIHGTLRAAYGCDRCGFELALRAAIDARVAGSSAIRDRAGRPAGIARVLPLPDTMQLVPSAPERLALVVFGPRKTNPDLITTVAAVYGFTPAETEVAAMLTAGATPAEIGRTLDKSIHTVRTQLRHMMEKTHVRRLAQLVALLKSP